MAVNIYQIPNVLWTNYIIAINRIKGVIEKNVINL